MTRRHDEEEPIRIEIDEEAQGLEPEMEAEAPSIDELQAEIDRMRLELDNERVLTAEEHDRYLRALADFSNFKRRHQEDYAQAMKFASRELILKILPIIDNFERAVSAAEQQHSFDSLAEGVKLTLRQFNDLLEREGIESIESVGQEFDPMFHEAVQRVETDEYPENTVVGEVQTGYKQGDQVIRPARVRVAASPG
jgi:molecular chaperone GrpE